MTDGQCGCSVICYFIVHGRTGGTEPGEYWRRIYFWKYRDLSSASADCIYVGRSVFYSVSAVMFVMYIFSVANRLCVRFVVRLSCREIFLRWGRLKMCS